LTSQIKNSIRAYLISDYITAAIAWLVFYLFRKEYETGQGWFAAIQLMRFKEIINVVFTIPIIWICLHALSGAYFNLYRKSRLHEIYRTLIISAIGCSLMFFLIVINDDIKNYSYYQKAFAFYILVQFLVSSIGRHIILKSTKNEIINGKFEFKTIMIGGNKEAIKIYTEIISNPAPLGNKFIGFVYAEENETNGLSKYLPKLGTLNEIESLIEEHQIDEAIIAIDSNQHHRLQDILTQLSNTGTVIKIQPDLYDIISGSVRTSNVLGAVMIEIYPELMPDWQRVVKRVLDVIISLLVLIIGAPFLLFTALKVKLSSAGDIIFKQERIGLHGKVFNILKFRSMYIDAEAAGPALSKDDDPRITQWGKVMRKWRIDELPQFYNILIGEMSLVGPRPERQFFINQISETHPQYKHLQIVKPGLTSWGMVKYGYASNIEEMKTRMKYDLLYIKNCSLALDTKILFYTILVILQGRGK
jgi:polysaccharide biosynthesis protein PslA